MKPISLFAQPYAEARALVATGAPVYLGVNPVEYHGPHLSLHNDTLIANGLARALHTRLSHVAPSWPFLVGADLEIGVEPTPGLGSRHIRFETARQLVLEAAAALYHLGAQRVVFMTSHGAPLHALAIQAGVDFLNARGVRALSPLNLITRKMLDLDVSAYEPATAHIADVRERRAVLDHLQFDFHAGFFETSLALHYAPESVAKGFATLADCPPVVPDAGMLRAARVAALFGRKQLASELRYAAFGVAWNQLRPFPGYTNRPRWASAEAGAYFAKIIVDEYTDCAAEVLLRGAPAPAPIMQWIPPLTLNGRLGSTWIPPHELGTLSPL